MSDAERIEIFHKEAGRHRRKLRELEANQAHLVQLSYKGLVSDAVLASEQRRIEDEQQAAQKLLAHSELQQDLIEDEFEEAARLVNGPSSTTARRRRSSVGS